MRGHLMFHTSEPVIERFNRGGVTTYVQTVVAAVEGRTMLTGTGRYYDAMTGAAIPKASDGSYRAVHGTDYQGCGLEPRKAQTLGSK